MFWTIFGEASLIIGITLVISFLALQLQNKKDSK